MAGTKNAVEQIKALIARRLVELDDERQRLVGVLDSLSGKQKAPTPGRRGRPSKSAALPARAPGRGKGRRKVTRANQALRLIAKKPGSNVSDVAAALKINRAYVYRILGSLEKTGKVKKKGRDYYPVD
ncbi:MAG TPA: helix-turn-helix domain-containing protein [Solirubrobacterales bacterium]